LLLLDVGKHEDCQFYLAFIPFNCNRLPERFIKRILLRIRFSTWSLLLVVLLLLLMSHVVGYLYMVYSGPTAATHDWLLWTANHIQGPQQPHMIYFFPKIQNFEKIFFLQKFSIFFWKKKYIGKIHYLSQKQAFSENFPKKFLTFPMNFSMNIFL